MLEAGLDDARPTEARPAAFYGCRLATGAVDWAMMFVLAERMGLDDAPVKAASAVVIVLGYVASRRVVFRGRGVVY